jgi:hypothetical protein
MLMSSTYRIWSLLDLFIVSIGATCISRLVFDVPIFLYFVDCITLDRLEMYIEF